MTPEAILALFEKNGNQFSGRNLATAMHRIGKLGGRNVRQDPRLAQMIEMCGRRIGDFKPQEIANSAWGCAKIGITDQRFFNAVAEEVSRQIEKFNPQAMANTVWAFATAGVAADSLFKAVAAEFPRRIGEFNAQAMGSTVWAFATASVAADPLFKAVAAEVPRRSGQDRKSVV